MRRAILVFLLYLAPVLAAAYEPATLALVQYNADSQFGELRKNRDNLTKLALEAAGNGAKIIVFPESSTTGYVTEDELWCLPGRKFYGSGSNKVRCRDVSLVAEQVPGGESSSYWSEFASRHGVYVVFSVIEKRGTRFHNSIVAAGPHGSLVKYAKRALFTVDKAYASSGDGPVVLETPFGRFGLMICLDGVDAGGAEMEYNFGFYAEYRGLGVNAILIPMDFDDEEPNTSPTSAKQVFESQARKYKLDIFAADHSPWDGTGKYPALSGKRERKGLPEPAVGENGISYHRVAY